MIKQWNETVINLTKNDLPFHRMTNTLVALIEKIELFLPFMKQEKGCLFTIFVYILYMSYIFKFKSAFGNDMPFRIS